jgi:BirA family biotin operon repressor/biotin-[acetyl-CoA-carboxylase] ligase
MQEFLVHTLTETGSTNQYALELLSKETLPEGTVIITNKQTAGKGVDGSEWESEEGKNLTFSIIIYPYYINADLQFYLNKAISLGVYQLVTSKLGDGVSIKWPNDIYFKQGKIAGMLIQNGIQGSKFSYCVAGIGLNVNQVVFSVKAENAVSLKMISGIDYDLDNLLKDLYTGIWYYLDLLKSGQLRELDLEYLKALFRFNEPADYIIKGKLIRAKISGVGRMGHLILEISPGKTMECDLKEVEFVL